MSTVPPGLLYLAIYNPTLKPSGPIIGDDEDAEEQAHILFYTGREQAVSRDRILRQVGLAKALINFTSMFTTEICENAHSQSRRMIMLSPEPDFWVHACVELAKSPRPAPSKMKGKAVAKEPTVKQELIYDYHDGSVNDLALKTQIIKGYEMFKLTHGSFASILSSLGQQALELQLERFWTVWAWRWDLEDDMDFASHLGVPLHHAHRKLTNLLDTFAREHLADYATFALVHPRVVPSSAFLRAGFPGSLPQHILTRVPPPAPPPRSDGDSINATPDAEKQSRDVSGVNTPDDKRTDTARGHKTFSSLDMRNLKWMWNGLTFGKGTSAKPSALPTPSPGAPQDDATKQLMPQQSQEPQPDNSLLQPASGQSGVDVDTESLQEAISSDNGFVSATQPSTPNPDSTALPLESAATDGVGNTEPLIVEGATSTAEESSKPRTSSPEPAIPSEPPLEFSSTTIHLAKPGAPFETRRHKVWYATKDAFTLAVIAEADHPPDLRSVERGVLSLFTDMRTAVTQEDKESPEDAATPVAKILAPKDKHIISSGPFTSISDQGFTSRSEHLFNGRMMLDSDFDVQEVFSRGQNPQHWHISRRGLGTDSDGNNMEGEVFMEVARKESTLTDVDNELAGVIRRFVE